MFAFGVAVETNYLLCFCQGPAAFPLGVAMLDSTRRDAAITHAQGGWILGTAKAVYRCNRVGLAAQLWCSSTPPISDRR